MPLNRRVRKPRSAQPHPGAAERAPLLAARAAPAANAFATAAPSFIATRPRRDSEDARADEALACESEEEAPPLPQDGQLHHHRQRSLYRLADGGVLSYYDLRAHSADLAELCGHDRLLLAALAARGVTSVGHVRELAEVDIRVACAAAWGSRALSAESISAFVGSFGGGGVPADDDVRMLAQRRLIDASKRVPWTERWARLRCTPDVGWLCGEDQGALALLRSRGVCSLQDVDELDCEDIWALGLANAVVRRRLIDYRYWTHFSLPVYTHASSGGGCAQCVYLLWCARAHSPVACMGAQAAPLGRRAPPRLRAAGQPSTASADCAARPALPRHAARAHLGAPAAQRVGAVGRHRRRRRRR